jgi:hypothetical protein
MFGNVFERPNHNEDSMNFGKFFQYESVQYYSIIKLCHLVWHYGTFLVAQQASKPAEYKHVDQDQGIDHNRL